MLVKENLISPVGSSSPFRSETNPFILDTMNSFDSKQFIDSYNTCLAKCVKQSDYNCLFKIVSDVTKVDVLNTDDAIKALKQWANDIQSVKDLNSKCRQEGESVIGSCLLKPFKSSRRQNPCDNDVASDNSVSIDEDADSAGEGE